MNSIGVAATKAVKPTQITVSPHDPIIVRDGRPFGAGSEGANRARSLDWPYPSTVAGAVRTLVGRLAAHHTGTKGQAQNPFHDAAFLERLKRVKVWGPLPLADGDLYVPTPLDFLVYDSGDRVSLRPRRLRDEEGCDLPHQGLWPINVPRNEKPGKSAAFLSMRAAARWLAQDAQGAFDPEDILEHFAKDERVHVRIDADTQTADDSQLFSTQGLVIPDIDYQRSSDLDETAEGRSARATHLALLVQSSDDELAALAAGVDSLHPFGGERRLARFHSETPAASWQCPPVIHEGLSHTSGIRMLLVTPAIFRGGWLPGWLDSETLEGSPPGAQNLRLRLRGASTGRWRAVSGWSMERGHPGPKPIRRLVPSGSVYFFEVVAGSAQELADLWLCPVSDEPQDRNDGFGLTMWGVWDIKAKEGGSQG
ncbi:MAG: type III-B CRISPR module-associated protein Cmr3 [Firmicutes bacterium]|nr:type III-B CRISPR module-associated protein Cmr3 [Bacillota bacterium]